MLSVEKNLEIQDIFVIDRGGLTYFSKCYGGTYCQVHPDHALQTGFLAAIYSFSGEFGQKSLKLVKFEELKLIFKLIAEIEVILVFVVLASDGITEIEEKMNVAAKIFLENYGMKVTPHQLIDSTDYTTFANDLENVLNKKPSMDIQFRKKPSLWQRIKGIWF